MRLKAESINCDFLYFPGNNRMSSAAFPFDYKAIMYGCVSVIERMMSN